MWISVYYQILDYFEYKMELLLYHSFFTENNSFEKTQLNFENPAYSETRKIRAATKYIWNKESIEPNYFFNWPL